MVSLPYTYSLSHPHVTHFISFFSKGKDRREEMEDGKKTEQVKSETRYMTACHDENNMKQGFSSTEKRDRKAMTVLHVHIV